MRFRSAGPLQKKFKKVQRHQEEFKWQVCFCWLPHRIDDNTVLWLERAARRRVIRDTQYKRIIGQLVWRRSNFIYGPITNVLMQPGANENVIGGGGGSGNLQAQASCGSVQGGLAAASGQIGQGVQLQGAAHVSYPPPGGLNSSSP